MLNELTLLFNRRIFNVYNKMVIELALLFDRRIFNVFNKMVIEWTLCKLKTGHE